MNSACIGFFGNVCNYSYWHAKWARELGFDAQAFLWENPSLERDMPWWEDSDYHRNQPPHWVTVLPSVPVLGSFGGRTLRQVACALETVDSLHIFEPGAAIVASYTSSPYVYHSAGEFGYLTSPFRFKSFKQAIHPKRFPATMRFRRAMRRARSIVLGQFHEVLQAQRNGFGQKLVMGFCGYDPNLTNNLSASPPRPLEKQRALCFFAPARHLWFMKGQHLIVRAFHEFSRTAKRRARLILLEWGRDVTRTRVLVEKLGIASFVTWLPILRRQELYAAMSRPDTLVIDQFPDRRYYPGGGIGGIGRDAMAVEACLCTYAEGAAMRELYGDPPPILSVERSEVPLILERMVEFAEMNAGQRAQIAAAQRAWLVKIYDYHKTIPKIYELHTQVLQEGKRGS